MKLIKTMKKFKLTNETKKYGVITLYRIESLRDFGNVSKGDKGGWVENEGNLSHASNAWISGDAEVYGDARVFGDTQAETGYWFAHKHEDWDITEVDMGGGWKTLVRDYKEPSLVGKEVEVIVDGKTYKAVIKEN